MTAVFIFLTHIKHYKKYTDMSYLFFFSFFLRLYLTMKQISKGSKEKQTQFNSQLPLKGGLD